MKSQATFAISSMVQAENGNWDDFISVPIKAPELDSIRAEASMVELPISPTGIDELKRLLVKAEALAGTLID
jgi:hypothetical protein